MKMLLKVLLPILITIALVIVAGILFANADAAQSTILPGDMRDGEALFSFPLNDDIDFHRHSVIIDGKRVDQKPCPDAAVLMRIADGMVARLEIIDCGDRARELDSPHPPRNLGEVAGPACADFLLSLVPKLPAESAEEAVVGAAVSRDAVVCAPIQKIARDEEMNSEVRESAVFWLGQNTAAKATEGLKQILDDEDEDLELREHAIFALCQGGESRDALSTLMRIAENNSHPQLRKSAIFWMSQYDDPEVLDYFEKILVAD